VPDLVQSHRKIAGTLRGRAGPLPARRGEGLLRHGL